MIVIREIPLVTLWALALATRVAQLLELTSAELLTVHCPPDSDRVRLVLYDPSVGQSLYMVGQDWSASDILAWVEPGIDYVETEAKNAVWLFGDLVRKRELAGSAT